LHQHPPRLGPHLRVGRLPALVPEVLAALGQPLRVLVREQPLELLEQLVGGQVVFVPFFGVVELPDGEGGRERLFARLDLLPRGRKGRQRVTAGGGAGVPARSRPWRRRVFSGSKMARTARSATAGSGWASCR
jgi:hypothetical protein